MIKIEQITKPQVGIVGYEVVSIMPLATNLEEHQLAELILKEFLKRGFFAKVSTDKPLPYQENDTTN